MRQLRLENYDNRRTDSICTDLFDNATYLKRPFSTKIREEFSLGPRRTTSEDVWDIVQRLDNPYAYKKLTRYLGSKL